MILQISDRVRVEPGPPRKKAVATRELLDDNITHEKYRVGALDSFSKTIVLGEPMAYVDWYCPESHWVWNVYLLDVATRRYWPIEGSPYATEKEAVAVANDLAAAVAV